MDAGLSVLVEVAQLTVARTGAPPAAVSCDLHKDGRKLGTTYVTSLKVQHVSCAKRWLRRAL